MSVNEKMTLLADAVRAKSGTTGPLSIDGMTTVVNSITVGIDTSDATAVASDIATGKTAYVKGELVTGTGVEPVYYKCLDSNLVSPAAAQSLADWYTISSNSGVGWYAFRLGEAHSYWEAKSIYADGEYPPAQLKIQFNEKKRVDGYRIKFYNNGSLYYPTSRINLYGVTSTSNLALLDSLSGEDYMGDNEIRREFSSGTYSAYVLEFTDDLLSGSGQWNVAEFALYSAESPYWAGYKAYKYDDDYRFEIGLTDRLVFTGDTPPSPGKCYSADGFVEVNLSGSPWGSDTTATASDISDGKTAYIMGERVAGTMPDSEITVEDNIVTVTAGRVIEDATATIPEMTITNDGKNITVPVGYNKTEQTFMVGGGSSGADVTLGMVNDDGKFQSLAFNGQDAVVSGPPETVENFYGWQRVGKAADRGITVYTVGDAVYYKCASVDTTNKTWSGYKAVFADGVYSFEETLTGGLPYGGFTPAVGSVYDSSAYIRVASLVQDMLYPMDSNTVAYLNFDDGSISDAASHITTNSGGLPTADGVYKGGWFFDGGYIQIIPKDGDFSFGTGDFTMEAYIYPINSKRQCLFGYEKDTVFSVAFSYNGNNDLCVFYAGSWSVHTISSPLTLNTWHHVAFVRKDGILSCFVDGIKQDTVYDLSSVSVGVDGQKLGFGRWGGDPSDFNARWQGSMDEIRISNIARYTDNFTPAS